MKPAGVHRALGEHARERGEVVLERRPRQRLQRRALDVGLIHHRVLLLEVEHRGAHLGVVRAGLVLARVHQPLAGEALLDLGEREPLGLEAQVLLRRPWPCADRRRRAPPGRRRPPPRAPPRSRCVARAVLGQLLLLGAGAPGPDLSTASSVVRVERARAARPRVDQEARAAAPTARAGCRRARGSFARPPRAAGRRRRCDRRRARVNTDAVARRPSSTDGAQASERSTTRQPARARRVGVDLPLFASPTDDLDGAPLRRKIRQRGQRVRGARSAAGAARGARRRRGGAPAARRGVGAATACATRASTRGSATAASIASNATRVTTHTGRTRSRTITSAVTRTRNCRTQMPFVRTIAGHEKDNPHRAGGGVVAGGGRAARRRRPRSATTASSASAFVHRRSDRPVRQVLGRRRPTRSTSGSASGATASTTAASSTTTATCCDRYGYSNGTFNMDYLWQSNIVRGQAQLDWHVGVRRPRHLVGRLHRRLRRLVARAPDRPRPDVQQPGLPRDLLRARAGRSTRARLLARHRRRPRRPLLLLEVVGSLAPAHGSS